MCNGQTVYTIVVNLGSLELQVVAGEINNINVENVAYAPDVEPTSPFNYSLLPMVTMNERQSKCLSVRMKARQSKCLSQKV